MNKYFCIFLIGLSFSLQRNLLAANWVTSAKILEEGAAGYDFTYSADTAGLISAHSIEKEQVQYESSTLAGKQIIKEFETPKSESKRLRRISIIQNIGKGTSEQNIYSARYGFYDDNNTPTLNEVTYIKRSADGKPKIIVNCEGHNCIAIKNDQCAAFVKEYYNANKLGDLSATLTKCQDLTKQFQSLFNGVGLAAVKNEMMASDPLFASNGGGVFNSGIYSLIGSTKMYGLAKICASGEMVDESAATH